MKNLETGAIIVKTLRPEESFEDAYIEERRMIFSYRVSDTYHFMDQHTFEEMTISKERLSESADYLTENCEVTARLHDGHLLTVTIPIVVVLTVIDNRSLLELALIGSISKKINRI